MHVECDWHFFLIHPEKKEAFMNKAREGLEGQGKSSPSFYRQRQTKLGGKLSEM